MSKKKKELKEEEPIKFICPDCLDDLSRTENEDCWNSDEMEDDEEVSPLSEATDLELFNEFKSRFTSSMIIAEGDGESREGFHIYSSGGITTIQGLIDATENIIRSQIEDLIKNTGVTVST